MVEAIIAGIDGNKRFDIRVLRKWGNSHHSYQLLISQEKPCAEADVNFSTDGSCALQQIEENVFLQ